MFLLYSLLFECYADLRDLNVLTHSVPTRRSSHLIEEVLQAIIRTAREEANAAVCAQHRERWLMSAAHASSQLYASEPTKVLHALRDGLWPEADPQHLPRWLAQIGRAHV